MSETVERIVVPSKYTCDGHGYFSDEKPCPECAKKDFVKIQDLHGKRNFVIGALVDENGTMQIVCNTSDEGRLWATFHRIESAIRFVLEQEMIKREASKVQVAPASVLDKLRG